MTVLPIPTSAPSPIETFWIIETFGAIHTSLPIFTLPDISAQAVIKVLSPMVTLWAMCTKLSIFTLLPMTVDSKVPDGTLLKKNREEVIGKMWHVEVEDILIEPNKLSGVIRN